MVNGSRRKQGEGWGGGGGGEGRSHMPEGADTVDMTNVISLMKIIDKQPPTESHD